MSLCRYFIVLRILNNLGEAGGWPTLIKMLDHNFNLEEKRVMILTGFASCKCFGEYIVQFRF